MKACIIDCVLINKCSFVIRSLYLYVFKMFWVLCHSIMICVFYIFYGELGVWSTHEKKYLKFNFFGIAKGMDLNYIVNYYDFISSNGNNEIVLIVFTFIKKMEKGNSLMIKEIDFFMTFTLTSSITYKIRSYQIKI